MVLVSVVTATYAGDDPAQLAEAIDSIVGQTHRPLQLLVAADGELPAATEQLIAQRRSQHPWIEIHRLAGPAGPAAARNSVLPKCRGEYVAILDADDAMVPERLAEQVDYLREHPDVDLVASWLAVTDAAGRALETRRFPESWQEVRARSAFFCPTANTAMLVRARVLPQFRYPTALRVGEDYRLWVTLMRSGLRIANIPRPLTRYRTGPGYFARRRGYRYALSDLVTKITALPLAPWWQAPAVLVVAGATFVVRLLPASWFQGAYGVFEKVTRG